MLKYSLSNIYKILFISFSLLLSINIFSQNIENKILKYKIFRDQINDSIIFLTKEKNKLFYLNFLPSVSYNFLDNSFNAGINLSSFTNYFQQKNRNKIEREKLRLSLTEKLDNEILKIIQEAELLQQDSINIFSDTISVYLLNELKQIKDNQFKNNQLIVEDYNQFLQMYHAKINNLNAQKQAYFLRRKNLLRKISTNKKSTVATVPISD